MLDWFIFKNWAVNTALVAGWFTFLTSTDILAIIGGIIGAIAGFLKIIEHFQTKKKIKLEIQLLESKIKEVDKN